MTSAYVFSGGAFGGFLQIGALRCMEMFGLERDNVTEYCGVSVGSVVALCAVLSVGADEMLEMSHGLHDVVSDTSGGGLMSSAMRFMQKGALASHAVMRRIISKVVFEPRNIDDKVTFLQLHAITNKRYVVVATSKQNGSEKVFDYESTPNVICIDAIIASMSIPAIFDHVVIGNDSYYDGCLSNPCPLEHVTATDVLYFRIIAELGSERRRTSIVPEKIADIINAISNMNNQLEMAKYEAHKNRLGVRLTTVDLVHSHNISILNSVRAADKSYLVAQGILQTHRQLLAIET